MTRRSVLAVGAHPDDIELGCGGALAKHVAAGDRVTMLVVTRGEEGPGRSSQRVSEQLAAGEVLGVDKLLWGEGFLDCRVSLQEFELVHLIEDAIEQVSATVVYTHMANDSHQDHRVVSRCTMGAARWVSTIMAYGGPSAVGFNPTAFIDISESLDKKIEALMCHKSQAEASEKVSAAWVRSAAEHYGFLCRRPFAEGFDRSARSSISEAVPNIDPVAVPTFLVVGAGTTGIGAAVRLTELGIDHLVVDAGDRLGGMSASVTDDAGFTWDLGGHVLHSHFADFDDAVEASGVRLNHVSRNGWVWLHGDGPDSLVPTPIQQQLAEMPTDLYPDAPVGHLADYYRNNFGRKLYDEFFEPYNRKMWTLPLEDVDHEWTSLRSGSAAPNVPVLGLAGGPAAPASTFPYPVGGTGALWQAVHDRLMTPASVRMRTRVVDIDPVARVAHLDDGSTVEYRFCISTAPVTTALGWIGWTEPVKTLHASRIHAVGLGYSGEPPTALADKTWLYCPAGSVPWYRATMLSNYDAANAGPGRWNILCEVPVFAEDPISADDAVDGVRQSLHLLGADPARVVSRFAETLDFGYPVPTLGRDALLREADERLRAHGIYSRGRFGGWRYESSNQDYGYAQGRQAVDNALTGSPEDVYWHPERF